MMKNIIKTAVLGIALAGLSQSCNLNIEPQNKIPFEKSFLTFKDAKQWDNGLYATLRRVLGGEYILPQEAQADMLSDMGGGYPLLHNWTMRADGGFFGFYRNYYSLLVEVNIILDRLPKIEVAEEQKAERDTFLGHAYFTRAYYYFNLALRWGVPYQEATASKDLCVPLELTPYKSDNKAYIRDKKARATNKEVYDLILSDLAKAEELIAEKGKQGNDEISKDLVKALRSRVYLYMNKMEEALKESESLIASDTYPLIPALAEGEKDAEGQSNPFIQMWQHDSGVEQIWQPFVSKPDEIPTAIHLYGANKNLWTEWKDKLNGENVNSPSYLPSGPVVYKLFDVKGSSDRRIPAYFEEAWLIDNTGKGCAKAYVISKFKGNPEYKSIEHEAWGGYIPNGIQAPKPFRIAEQYLIAAEAAYNVGDNAKAHKYLNELRASRGLKPVQAIAYDLEQAIQDERARELAYEGFRLWDLRRWHLGIDGRKRQGEDMPEAYGEAYKIENPALYFSKDENVNIEIKPNDYRFLWAFPYEEVSKVNKKLVQNKGW